MKRVRSSGRGVSRRRSAGLTLVELMISLVLGLLVVGVAIGIFASSKQTYDATESLGRIQESVRTGFELMARDLRQTAGNQCNSRQLVANVISGARNRWWSSIGIVGPGGVLDDSGGWTSSVRGFDGVLPAALDAPANRVANTDVIQVMATGEQVYTVQSHSTASGAITLNTSTHNIRVGDVLVVCGVAQASIFQARAVVGANIGHGAGGSISPGNCTAQLGIDLDAPNCVSSDYEYLGGSTLAPLYAVRWYVGDNGRGGRSLYQGRLRNNSGTASVTAEEVVEGVRDMQVTYLVNTSHINTPDLAAGYVDASSVAANAWDRVVAVRVELVLEGERPGTDGNRLSRRVFQVINLRNRAL